MKPTANEDPGFDWEFVSTMIAGRPFSLAVASDPDGMLIDACERQDAGESGVIDPFWATTWRAAAGLDAFMDRLTLDRVRVLELGCGTGHVGIAAARRGAIVTMTDGVNDPLDLVRHSIAPLDPPPTLQRLRFGMDRLDVDRFPIIFGSDVTYLRTLWPQLDDCLRDHLATQGRVYLSDPFRFIADEFRERLDREYWDYVEHTVRMEDDPEHPIRVMELTRRC